MLLDTIMINDPLSQPFPSLAKDQNSNQNYPLKIQFKPYLFENYPEFLILLKVTDSYICYKGTHPLDPFYVLEYASYKWSLHCIFLSSYLSFYTDKKKCKVCATSESLHFLFLFYFVLPVTFFPRYSGGSYSTSIGTHYCKSPTLHFLCLLKDTLRIEHHQVATKKV